MVVMLVVVRVVILVAARCSEGFDRGSSGEVM